MQQNLRVHDQSLARGEAQNLTQRFAGFGYLNSLSQLLCKLTVPGVPDIYQGCELWDDSLVDPDNRRPVDYNRRREVLASITRQFSDAATSSPIPDVLTCVADGSAKLYVIHKVLNFRRAHADLFREGAYRPLKVTGDKAAHLCAYARTHPSGTVIVLVPRLFARLLGEKSDLPVGADVWDTTTVELPTDLHSADFVSILGTANSLGKFPNGAIRVGMVLREFPVGLITTLDPVLQPR